MLSKKRRAEKSLFPRVLSKSKSFYGKNMTVRVFLLNSPDKNSKSKFSFVVSKKVSNKAVKRNLLKRRGYSVVKDIKTQINEGFVCVFFFKTTTINLSYIELKKEITFLLKKSNILN